MEDLFAAAPRISRRLRTRRMFGGLGVYSGDVMKALVAYGELYLKVDGETKPAFEAAGATPLRLREQGDPREPR